MSVCVPTRRPGVQPPHIHPIIRLVWAGRVQEPSPGGLTQWLAGQTHLCERGAQPLCAGFGPAVLTCCAACRAPHASKGALLWDARERRRVQVLVCCHDLLEVTWEARPPIFSCGVGYDLEYNLGRRQLSIVGLCTLRFLPHPSLGYQRQEAVSLGRKEVGLVF